MSAFDHPAIRIRVTVLIRRDDGRLCLVRHRKHGRVYWLLPGGGQELFEPAEEAARREVWEEIRVKIGDLRLCCLRESMDRVAGRHIQFLIFSAGTADFSTLQVGDDPRVDGVDFVPPEELSNLPVYPAMQDDLAALLAGQPVPLFRTLPWVP
jgi:8-oxo-dGTP diphosphatase